MTGIEEYNYPAFEHAAAELRRNGHEVVSPHELSEQPVGEPEDAAELWRSCMRKCLAALAGCDAIALLPGWQHSRGASLELFVATQLGLRVIIALDSTPIILTEEHVDASR